MFSAARIFSFFLSAFFLFLFPSVPAFSAEKVWRILYIEGGPFTNYQQTLAHTARALQKMGVIENGDVAIPEHTESTAEMWQWLAEHAGGSRIAFLKDGHYSAQWDSNARARVKNEVMHRIKTAKDVDMIIAMGTWSGIDMTEEDMGIPVFSMSVTDAVAAGIVKSVEDSGKNNVHAQLEPGRFRRQISMFYEIFKFKKLGIVYEDTPEGRNTAAVAEIERTAEELGFELVRSTAALDIPDVNIAFNNLRHCLKELSRTSDAVYITYNSIPVSRIPELMPPVTAAGIPSFDQAGPQAVEYGVLMSLAQASFADIGRFEAEAINAVLNGANARDVSQIFEPELGLAINLKTAMKIGWNPPIEILAAVDKVYKTIPAGR